MQTSRRGFVAGLLCSAAVPAFAYAQAISPKQAGTFVGDIVASVKGVSGPVRYVDSVSGLDTNNGLTPSTAWQTPAKVAGLTLPASTTVYFKRGSLFSSTYVPTQAGLIHDAYGTGANPVFDASTPIVTTWTQGTGVAATEAQPSGGFASGFETASFTDWTSVDQTALTISQSTTYVQHGTYSVKMLANATANDNRGGLNKGLGTWAANNTYWQRLYFYMPAGTFGNSQQIKLIYATNGSGVLLSFLTDGSGNINVIQVGDNNAGTVNYANVSGLMGAWHYVDWGFKPATAAAYGGGEIWLDGTQISNNYGLNTSATVGTTSIELGNNGYGPCILPNQAMYFDNYIYNAAIGRAGAASFAGFATTIWSTPLASNPLFPVFPTGTQTLNMAANTSAITGAGQWYWASGTLYVYGPGNPGSTIGAPNNNYAIQLTAIQNLTFNNITVRGAKVYGLYGSGNVSGLSLGSGFLAESNYTNGVSIVENTATIQNVSFKNATFRYNGASGFELNAGYQINNYFGYNRAYGNCTILTGANSDLSFSAGIHWYSSVANTGGPTAANAGQGTIIEYNWSYNNGPGSTNGAIGRGAHLDTVNGMIVRYNNLYGNSASGCTLEKNGSSLVYGNNAWNNASIAYCGNFQAICSSGNTMSGCKFFNNTSYGGYEGFNISPYQGLGTTRFDNNAFTNNIVAGITTSSRFYVDAAANNAGGNGTGNTYTYNNFGAALTSFAFWYNTFCSTYAAFDTAAGVTTHNIQGDPLFTNPAGNDFSLQVGSPCLGASVAIPGYIAAGTNLGSGYAASL